MRVNFGSRPFWSLIFALSTVVSAYRPTQFCKHRGENGKADLCFAINTFYNSTTQQSDLYITLHAFRFKSSASGWASVGMGERMIGALMFIVYGDPSSPGHEMTTVVRTATGHHPPLSVTDTGVYEGPIPEIEVRSSHWVDYTGDYVNQELGFAPSHVGVAEIICYSCDIWEGFPIKNSSIAQPMIWGTSNAQDMQGDFSPDRGIEMHQFGLGFGFLWTDLANARVTKPMFPTIFETTGHLGISEVGPPLPPKEDELNEGDRLEGLHPDQFEDEEHDQLDQPTSTIKSPPAAATTNPHGESNPKPASTTQTSAPSKETDTLQYPAPTILGKSLRDWMWHLHGFFMVLSFMILYPLGALFIRSPRPTAFNLHWTTQAFATVLVFIAAGIGYYQSNGLSATHQFMGLAICALLVGQLVLGYVHHGRYVVAKRKTWLSVTHVWLGRLAILPMGFMNVLLGVLLRRYGRWVVTCLVVALIIEGMALIFFLGQKSIRNLAMPPSHRTDLPTGDEAEEYFQLVGDEDEEDDEDESIDEGEPPRMTKQEMKRDQAQRLAKLDKV